MEDELDDDELFELEELLLLDELDLDDELDDFDDDELDDFDEELDDDDDELEELERDEELLLDAFDELEPDDDEEDPPALPPPSTADDEFSVVILGATGLPPQPLSTPAAATAPPDSSSRKLRRAVSLSSWPVGRRVVDRFSSIILFSGAISCLGKLDEFWFVRQVLDGAAVEVHLDPARNLVGGNHVHAAWQAADDIYTQFVGTVLVVAIANGEGARLPAAAALAAFQGAHGVQILMMRISREVRWFAAASDNDARPALRHAGRRLDGRGEMHQETYRTDDALRMVDKPHQLAQSRLTS